MRQLPDDANQDQLDTDGDTTGDACDSDDDADTVRDEVDSDPLDPNRCSDTDRMAAMTVRTPPLNSGPDPANDGVDTDGDGQCDSGTSATVTTMMTVIRYR